MEQGPQATPDRHSSEELMHIASARKMQVEIQLLEQQLTPAHQRQERLKTLAGASGLLIAMVTVIGGLLSVFGWFLDQAHVRDLRAEERLERVLGLLAEDRESQKMAAIGSLRSFIDPDNAARNAQVLVSIANALPIEQSGFVRNAMISFFEDLDAKDVGKPALDAALKSLIYNSRGLIRESDLLSEPPVAPSRVEELVKRGPILQITARAMVTLMRKGARSNDLSAVYLGQSNLSGLDLSGTKFDRSYLALSDFSDATLRDASFNFANLEGTNFVSANLSGAKFTGNQSKLSIEQYTSYIESQMTRFDGRVVIWLPDFRCADLRGADFTGYPLFAIARNDIWGEFTPVFRGFDGANLVGADMTHAKIYALRRNNDDRMPISSYGSSSRFLAGGKRETAIIEFDVNAALVDDPAEFSESLTHLKDDFSGSNWKSARLPKFVGDWFARVGTPEKVGSIAAYPEPCTPRAPW